MSLLLPFRGLRPTPEQVHSVIAPPYDVVSRAEAYQLAKDKPDNFLHISKPEIDLPLDVDAYNPRVYQTGRANFQRFLQEGILHADQQAAFYAYRLTENTHQQSGLLAAVAVEAYLSGRIRKHELTRADKERDRVQHLTALNAQVSPVLLTYRRQKSIDELMEKITTQPADLAAVAGDSVKHELWVINKAQWITELSQYFSAVDYFYIADGHHRTAAAARVAAEYSQNAKNNAGLANYFLAGLFPDNQLKILGYHRALTDLHFFSVNEFLQKLAENFVVTPEKNPKLPAKTGEFAMYLAQIWYRLQIKNTILQNCHDPISRLDVALLQNYLLQPILGITDPRTDKRLHFIGGDRGLPELQRSVDSGEMAVSFALFPVTAADLFSIADAHQIMPPKSTWFTPKLADGLVSMALITTHY